MQALGDRAEVPHGEFVAQEEDADRVLCPDMVGKSRPPEGERNRKNSAEDCYNYDSREGECMIPAMLPELPGYYRAAKEEKGREGRDLDQAGERAEKSGENHVPGLPGPVAGHK